MEAHRICIPHDMPVHYAQSVATADLFLRQLTAPVLGIDLEWRPNFTKGAGDNSTATVQVSDGNCCVILHVKHMLGTPDELRRLLADQSILKVGQGFDGEDRRRLRDDLGIDDIRPVADCLTMAREWLWRELEAGKPLSFESCNLRIMAASLLHLNVPRRKKTQMSNWNQKPLSFDQLTYAAEDAALTLACWQKLTVGPVIGKTCVPVYAVLSKPGSRKGPLNDSSEAFMAELIETLSASNGRSCIQSSSIVPSLLMCESGTLPAGLLLCGTMEDARRLADGIEAIGFAAWGFSFKEAVSSARNLLQSFKKGDQSLRNTRGNNTDRQKAIARDESNGSDNRRIIADAKTVFVKDVPRTVACQDVIDDLSSQGFNAIEIIFPTRAKNGKTRNGNPGFGFAKFESESAVQVALDGAPYTVHGVQITIREYIPRAQQE